MFNEITQREVEGEEILVSKLSSLDDFHFSPKVPLKCLKDV
jgi:hypothetical protein